jgi:hypothetical protein
VTTLAGTAGAQGALPGLLPATLNSVVGIAYYNGVLVTTSENGILVAAKTGGW